MKKSIFKRIGLICLSICVAIGSFFVGVHKNGHDSKFASADSTASSVTFTSSNIIYSCLGNTTSTPLGFSDLLYGNASNPVTSLDWLNFSFKVNYSSVYNYVSAFVEGSQGSNYGLVSTEGSYTDMIPFTLNVDLSSSSTHSILLNPFKFRIASSYSNTMLGFVVYHENGLNSSIPTLDMVSIEIGNYTNFDFIDTTLLTNSNVVCYTDSNNYKFLFFIPCYQDITYNSYMYYDYRIYFTSNSFDLSDSQLYNYGYNQGLADNQQNIYNNGYEAGYDVGFGSGRADGIISANDYSFPGLIGAVLDVPVQTFMSLLHFEILGIDLANFILGLLTLGLVIFVIKLIMGGK